MVLMIDNYDSFTYNIVQYCRELGADLNIIRNDELTVDEIEALAPQKIILSPGPATPDEAGVTLDVIKRLKGKIPMLGICLGHQAIGQAFGGKVVRAPRLMHGKTSIMRQTAQTPLFKGIPNKFTATRYHSLVVEKESCPAALTITAVSEDDDQIMAFESKELGVYGVQFHPESIMSEYGHEILKNFLEL
ncbi:MAG: aminodeoxychorismate/anthranilate synthase component II [Campylobacterales bacterium]